MDILGIVNIYVKVPKFEDPILQEFKVLNSSVCPKVLTGRDFMTRSDTVKFDFNKTKIQLGRIWINGINIKGRRRLDYVKIQPYTHARSKLYTLDVRDR